MPATRAAKRSKPRRSKPSPEKFGKGLDEIRLLTSMDLCRIFAKSPGTILNWRRYEGRLRTDGGRRSKLPCIRIGGFMRDTIRFRRDDILAWAKKYDIPIVNEAE